MAGKEVIGRKRAKWASCEVTDKHRRMRDEQGKGE